MSLPPGAFQPHTGAKTSIVFFWNTGSSTSRVWFYDLQADGSTLSTAREFSLKYPNDIPDLLAKWPVRADSERSWSASLDEIAAQNWDLSVSRFSPNPLTVSEEDPPDVVLRKIIATHQQLQAALEEFLEYISGEEVVE